MTNFNLVHLFVYLLSPYFFLRIHVLLSEARQPLYRLGGIVREEQAFALVQLADGRHVFGGKEEVEYIEVLLHALFVRGLRDDYHVALDEEAQGGLCHGLAVFLADDFQHGIGEEVVAPFSEWSPRHDLRAVLLHDFLRPALLVEHMRFHLVHHRFDVAELCQVDETVGVEVRYADGTELACLVCFFHSTVGAVVVVERLVDEQQVDVVGLQLAEGFVDRSLCLLIPGVGYPHLCHKKQFLARDATLLHRTAHALLVVVSLRRVYHPVAHAQGIRHAAFTLFRSYLIYTIT